MANLSETVKVRVTADEREWLRGRAVRTERSEGAIVRAALRLYRERVEREDGSVKR